MITLYLAICIGFIIFHPMCWYLLIPTTIVMMQYLNNGLEVIIDSIKPYTPMRQILFILEYSDIYIINILLRVAIRGMVFVIKCTGNNTKNNNSIDNTISDDER